MSELIVNRAEATCCTRREQWQGREHLIVPVVALLPGVLNGEYVPADEIIASAQLWNDVPIPIEHPRQRGVPVSARAPDVLAQTVAGRLYHASAGPDGRLRGEMWLDVERLQPFGNLLELLEAGGPVDVSTAYFRDLELTPGDVAGRPYVGIARNLRPDHLALLPASKGACSWADGCGAPRVNDADAAEAASATPDPAPENLAPRTPAAEPDGLETGDIKMSDELEQVVETEPEAVVETVAPETNAAAPVVPVELTELLAMVNELGGVAGLKAALADVKAQADAERTTLLAELTANERAAFKVDEIKSLGTPMLRKLAAALRPADYRGRGAPQTNDSGAEWVLLVAPEVK